ncbi:MAG: methyltransferase domain-containing protein [Candidatus Lokiarchaeota archaeon]|nr:methyltransferase domain-containing protein [Candidatus Lokiarchaeota archaeon]
MSKKYFLLLAIGLVVITPFLYVFQFITCLEGLILAEIIYSSMIGCLLLYSSSIFENIKIKNYMLTLLIIIPLFSLIITPISMLVKTSDLGIEYFLNERIWQFIYLEVIGLLLLAISVIYYSEEKKIYQKGLKSSLLSLFSLALYIRTFWILTSETKHIVNFANNYPQYLIHYVIICSIPLLFAIIILNLRNILIGYKIAFFFGLIHGFLTILLVVERISPGFGPIIVISSSFLISLFSIVEIIKYIFNNNEDMPAYMQFIMRQRLKLRKFMANKDIENVLKLLGIEQDSKIMDYGTGIGNYAFKASELMDNKGSIIAIDINPKMLNNINLQAKKKKIENIKTLLIKNLEDIKENDFNYIFLIDVLQFFKDKVSVINFLRNKLSNHGKLLIRLDHIDQNQIQNIFEECYFSVKEQIYKDYWIVS